VALSPSLGHKTTARDVRNPGCDHDQFYNYFSVIYWSRARNVFRGLCVDEAVLAM